MLKILYAASNNENAKIQLARFMKAMEGKPFVVKVAAYKKSSPTGMNVDWTLNALLDIVKPDAISYDSNSFSTFYEQVKYFSPDLVISDMEYFASQVANLLDITLWQCSSSLLNFAIEQKYNVGLFSKYSYLMNKNNAARTQRQINVLANSNYNFVYSHLGDTTSSPSLKDSYDWIRPYHTIGKDSVPCRHNIMAGTLINNRKILALLKKCGDSVVFTEHPYEQQSGLWLKDIRNQEEYFCNLKNCNLFVCEGQTSFLADAFYNGKYTLTITNFQDLECVMNSIFSEHIKLSSMLYQTENTLEPFLGQTVASSYNEKIRYLHEWIEEL
jgi:uncharacterized protein (TIGR00661 family)